MSASRWYLVQSPQYTYVEPILEDGSGPAYDERDVLWVRARTAVRAKVIALRTWRRNFVGRQRWTRDYLDCNPFAGMSVCRADSITVDPISASILENAPGPQTESQK